MPSLLVRSGPDAGRRFPLLGEAATVGRHSSSDIVLNDERVSRHHLVIRHEGDRWTFEDLGSGNGTTLNGVAATEAVLQSGDCLSLGDTVLVFDSDDRFATSILRRVPESAGATIAARLGVVYQAAAAASEILAIDELLSRILELVLDATGADQAGALLADEGTGELMPRAVRSRIPGEFRFSRTIAEYVRRERQGVLVSDAAADDRFQHGESVVRQPNREILCVPMRGRHDTVGQLFLHAQSRDGERRFQDDHLDLAVAVAHLAALAVEEARHYRALMNTERLAAVGQTIAGMSHHIKNILQGVRFGGDMIRSGLARDDREIIAKGWGLVEKNQKRIESLIGDMLSYSKEREPVRGPVDLPALVAEVIESLQGRIAKANVSVAFENCFAVKVVECDADAIHAAVMNLLTNALDALEGVESGAIRVMMESDEDTMTMILEDNGAGIPAEQCEAVFEPFVSSKGSRGTGLGLPVSRKILREHGGDLIAEANAPVGARFRLTLPIRKTA